MPRIICGGNTVSVFIVNKSTKRVAKWIAGALVMTFLCWNLYRQIALQLAAGAAFSWWPEGTAGYFITAVLLLPVNLALETLKWQIMIATADTIAFLASLKSILGGIAASVITPNRIGEFPGRIIALEKKRSTRLISVAVLCACSQMLSLMIWGIAGLGYYTVLHPEGMHFAMLIITAVFTTILALLYFSFERWAPLIERFKALRKLRMWARLLHRFTFKEQIFILHLSLIRFFIFALQYFLLLRWQGVAISFGGGMMLCALFFWVMAIIPSIALAELGIRGTVAVFLFSAFTANIAGLALSALALWTINLMLPAIAGAIILAKPRKSTSF